jgi:rhomboid family GlyGly-CTERM serine protease
MGLLVLVRLVHADGSQFVWRRSCLQAGEWWRLFTCHWVHFTPSHFFQNLAVFACCGVFLERRSRILLVFALLVSSLAIPLGLQFCDPSLAVYGGLSGVNHGLLFLVGLFWLRSGHRDLAFGLWALLAVKLGLELSGLRFSLVSLAGTEVRPVPLAHLLGLLSCVLLVPLAQRLDRAPSDR